MSKRAKSRKSNILSSIVLKTFLGQPIRDKKTGLYVKCKPGEEGEVIGTVRPDDRGGPEKFQVSFFK
jgi:hypothetical protein